MKLKTLVLQIPKHAYLAALILSGLSVSVPAQTVSPAVTNIWRLPAGVEPDFLATADNNVRGVAINPVNGNILYASRTGGSNHIAVVNAATGFVSNRLSGVGVTGGQLTLDQVKVTDDGVVYAANLAIAGTGGSSVLKLYRWDSDSTTSDPTNVFTVLTNATRHGETMDLRGSGTNTEIIMTGSGGNRIAYFTTKDGINFNAETNEFGVLTNYMKEIPFPAGVAAGDLGKGIAFDGTNNALYGKNFGVTTTRYLTFNPTALTATNIANITMDNRLAGLDVGVTNGFKIAGGILCGDGAALTADRHRARFWDITITNAPQLLFDDPLQAPTPPSTYYANANAIAAIDAKNGRIVVLEPNNGIALYQLYLITNPPPTITAQPVGNTNVLTGGFYTLNVGASGAGLKYQWYLNNNPVSLATNASLNLTNLLSSQAGIYYVVITNTGGSITSSNASIGLLPSVQSSVSAKLWQVNAGSRTYLTTDNNQRGMAFHALSNQLVIVNRAGTPSINLVNASTGATVTNLDMTGVGPQTGEQFSINAVGVAGDGAIYVCNLANISSGGAFTIYRWADANPATLATIAYGPDNPASTRIGDSFAVQGSGVNTKLIASTRSGTVVVVFTTTDGVTFGPNTVDVATAPTPAPAGFAGLGLAAGEGDSFWATSGGFQLRKVVYDLVNVTNDVTVTVGGQTGNNIGADDANGLVAAIGTGDVPSNLRILDVHNPAANAVLVDQEFFGSDNDNANGTGAVAFDVTGGRIFALDSNNGLIALKYAPRLKYNGNVLSWTGPGVLQASAIVTGTYTNVIGALSPYTSPASSSLFYRVQR